MCDKDVHLCLIDYGEIYCPFCDKQIAESKSQKDLCCDKPDIIHDNGAIVCKSCSSYIGYQIAREYVDFYENWNKIKRKSIYHRKYHIMYKLDYLKSKYSFELSYYDRQNIVQVFREINKILPELNGDRKRLININFLLKKLLTMLKINVDKMPVSSKKTQAIYEMYWTKITLLIGDKIDYIMNK